MDVDTRLELITRNTIEVVTREELREKLESGERLKGYIGYEPSGIVHVGWLVWMYKVRDLVEAGVDFTVLEATWHAFINDKLGGDMRLIKGAARLVRKVMEAVGVPVERVRFVDAEDLAGDREYWGMLVRASKKVTLARVKRALTIMGRRAEEAETDFSKLIYPLMQVTDIFYLDLDIALGGMDQRKAHMLARDLAEKTGRKKPIALHTPIITGLQGASRMEGLEVDEALAEAKMSKSKPETAIFVTDSEDNIRFKIRKAYCPARQVEGNPVMEIARYIIFYEPGSRLHVDRPSKYGGPVTYESYEELERDYVEGRLHPLDLKNAVAEELIRILKPVREVLLRDSEFLKLLSEVEARVTR
ncbi:MAG: tyrosine--tRNA ligase [Desulfurococcales archaeon]|nr:tyrosine--tRNA ligase [Desulfurococcales archaeon]